MAMKDKTINRRILVRRTAFCINDKVAGSRNLLDSPNFEILNISKRFRIF